MTTLTIRWRFAPILIALALSIVACDDESGISEERDAILVGDTDLSTGLPDGSAGSDLRVDSTSSGDGESDSGNIGDATEADLDLGDADADTDLDLIDADADADLIDADADVDLDLIDADIADADGFDINDGFDISPDGSSMDGSSMDGSSGDSAMADTSSSDADGAMADAIADGMMMDATTDADMAMNTCGNDMVDHISEVCDGADLAGATCIGEGFGGGLLSCQSDCSDVDTEGCIPLDACANAADLGLISAVDMDTANAACGVACLGDVDVSGCSAVCLVNDVGLSPNCAGCYGDGIACAIDQCILDCVDPLSQTCLDCQVMAGCTATHQTCAGLFEDDDTRCSDGLDNDADGLINCADPDCANSLLVTVCTPTEDTDGACIDGLDNDSDGAIDCADSGCSTTTACTTQCQNNTDLMIHGLVDVPAAGFGCASSCIADSDPASCTSTCMQTDPPGLSAGCAGCYGANANCGIANCVGECLASIDAPACIACLANNCDGAFYACSGFGAEYDDASCMDGLDNDGDGDIDCADTACAGLGGC